MVKDNPVIALENVSRCFWAGEEKVTVLTNVSLTIQRGEMVAIVGASGSGKSTLMNLIGCLDRPDEGKVVIKSRSMQQADPDELAQLRSQNIGFIFQRYHLIPYLSATENVEVPALYTALSADERRQRAEYLLSRLGLQSRMLHKPAQLSGGQQQRVSIARALMNGAEIILADEPTGALDRTSGQELMGILRSLNEAGHTIILVTHDPDIAAQAQRILHISDGEIVSDERNPVARDCINRQALPSLGNRGHSALGAGIREAIRMAWRAILGHRIRAFLSMLGIIIGIASVVTSVAAGEGARQSILAEISQLGTSTIEIRPGSGWDTPRPDYERSLKLSDVDDLATLPYVDSLSPVVSKFTRTIRGAKSVMVSLSGVSHGYFRVQGFRFIQGNGFTQADVDESEPVVIIDPELAKTLFGVEEEVKGKIIQIGGVPFRVLGVAERKGHQFSGSLPSAWMPYTALLSRMSGDMPIEAIALRVVEGYPLQKAQTAIEARLDRLHGQRDFFTVTNDQMTRAMQKASASMRLLITAIAGISLLVGGVGVMNIMLVSVTERTHEIGIRLSVGARPGDIMLQFLIEAMTICVLGGAAGIACSLLGGLIFAWLTDELSLIFTWSPIVLACGFSALIGLGFGFFPARNAARLQPTEALARE